MDTRTPVRSRKEDKPCHYNLFQHRLRRFFPGTNRRAHFPRHVVAKLAELMLSMNNTVEQESKHHSIGYRHLFGTLEQHDAFPLTTVHLWIASHDYARTLLCRSNSFSLKPSMPRLSVRSTTPMQMWASR